MVLKRFGASVVVAGVLTVLARLYMLQLRVPSVIEIRPRLTEVGLKTGIFSRRRGVYLWYHYPTEMTVFTFVILGGIVFISTLIQ